MNEETNLPYGPDLAIQYCGGGVCHQTAIDAIRTEHSQRLTLQHNCADLAQRVADLEAERDEWRQLASAYSPAKELATSLKQAKASGDAARNERDELRATMAACTPRLTEREDGTRYSPADMLALREREVLGLLGRLSAAQMQADGLRARLAELGQQEPVAWLAPAEVSEDWPWPYIFVTPDAHPHIIELLESFPVYAGPVHAQVAPDADGARYRWLKSRPVAVPTVGPDLALWSDCAGDALRGDDADAEIDAAMAAAPEHKA